MVESCIGGAVRGFVVLCVGYSIRRRCAMESTNLSSFLSMRDVTVIKKVYRYKFSYQCRFLADSILYKIKTKELTLN